MNKAAMEAWHRILLQREEIAICLFSKGFRTETAKALRLSQLTAELLVMNTEYDAINPWATSEGPK